MIRQEFDWPISFKCSMERVAAFNDESSWWNLAFEEGERNWEKEKSEVVE